MKFKGNLISILARGDQEMFHSAFFAWLLKEGETHGLGRMFLDRVLNRLPPEFSEGLSGDYDVKTEFPYKKSRFDILVHPKNDTETGLVIENKFKSFGYTPQIKTYESGRYKVAIFSLLRETLAKGIPPDKIIEYRHLLGIIMEIMPLVNAPNDYRFVIVQYAEFLENTLKIFKIFEEFFAGNLDQSTFQEAMKAVPISDDVLNNDCRTFSYFYYYRLAQHLEENEPTNLRFGKSEYAERGNTRWIYERNMPGAPFMEAVIRDIGILEKWAIQHEFSMLFESGADITPRLEVSLNPKEIRSEQKVGRIMLGTGDKNVQPKLKAILKEKSNATRNFYCEDITIQDLPYTKMTNRLHQMLEKILIFNGA